MVNWESVWTWTCYSGDTLLRHVGKHKQNIRSHAQWENEQLYPVSIRRPHTRTHSHTHARRLPQKIQKRTNRKIHILKSKCLHIPLSGFAILYALCGRLGGVGTVLRYMRHCDNFKIRFTPLCRSCIHFLSHIYHALVDPVPVS